MVEVVDLLMTLLTMVVQVVVEVLNLEVLLEHLV
tara:strand:- start:450 stop:551 length:102 start_codon:yes stop_codon:yes gene_type:complete